MITAFNIIGLAFLLLCFVSCQVSKSAMQETVVMLQLVVAAIFFVGAGIMREIRKHRMAAFPEKMAPGPGDVTPKKDPRPWKN